ncbi:flagellar basal-body MS-ring/collar protein FliF [Magnetococcus sp. PR-3]|uniref:flagellar basal-body MS-ring/collar protein FliF n=1 Tax=Magnetococcus sp. PR-3 TaxID=3120355 RepID=UPI002FCE2EE5
MAETPNEAEGGASAEEPSLGGMFGSLPLTGRNGVIIAAVATVFILAAIIWFATRPSFKVLYSGLPELESARIVEQLGKLGVPYQLGGGGTTIRIPEDKVYDVRLEMAKAGLPKSTDGVGFEIFDNQSLMGMTDFVQRMNYQRALQGELARSVESVAAVEKARVHLVLPKKSMFASEEREATASVVMELTRSLSKTQIEGITHMVAGAVEGLGQEQVTLLDHKGNLIAGGKGEDLDGRMATDDALALQNMKEKKIEDRVQSLLDRVLGPDKSIIRITAELDLDKKQRQEESYDPDGQVPLSTNTVTESSRGTFGTGGVPGVIPNDPNQTAVAGGTGSQQTRDVEREQVNFLVPKTVKTVQEAVGGIRRLSVAVMIDGTYEAVKNEEGEVDPEKAPVYKPRSTEEMDQLKRIIMQTVGFDSQRGDTIEVTNAAFEPLPPPPETKNPWLTREFQLEMAKYGAIALLAFLLVFFVMRPLVTKLLIPEEEQDDRLPGTVADLERQLLAEGVGAIPTDSPTKLLVPDRSLQLAQQMIEDNLEEAREIIRSWLAQDTY